MVFLKYQYTFFSGKRSSGAPAVTRPPTKKRRKVRKGRKGERTSKCDTGACACRSSPRPRAKNVNLELERVFRVVRVG